MSVIDQIVVVALASFLAGCLVSGFITWLSTSDGREEQFRKWLIRNKLAEWAVDPVTGETKLCKLHDSLDALDPF